MSLLPSPNLVLGLVAQNENQVLEAGSVSTGIAFRARGYEYRVIDMFKPSGGEELQQALASGQVAFAYGFAGVGSQLKLANGDNVWTAARTPFVCLWYDHPAYNYRQQIVDSPYVAHGYHIKDHLEVRQKYLPASSSQSVLLTLANGIYPEARAYPVAKRKREIIYAKTAYQPSAFSEDWKRHSLDIQKTLWSLVEQAQADRNLDLANAAVLEFSRFGLPAEDLNLFMDIIQEVDGYIRAWRSDLLARALLPFPARIYGRGWDYLKDEKRKAEFYPPIPVYEYLRQTYQSRIIANSNPLWRHGIHDRVDHALSTGSIVLTDNTMKSDELYKGMENFVGFEWNVPSLEYAVALAFTRADDDQTDFYQTAETVLAKQAQQVDYHTQIINIAAALRSQEPICTVGRL
jgi:hypothetical protein